MYNKCLEYLLDYRPEKTVSKFGSRMRKLIYPIARLAMPFMLPTKLEIIRSAKMPNRPVIFASTHGFKEDINDAMMIAGRQAYILIGSLTQIFKSVDGYAAWLVGTVLVDRMDKESRVASKEKMIRALELGSSIIIFPEGTWNKSPNQMVSGLFPGIYDIAKATGAVVAPIATHREGKKVYGILEEAFDITAYDRAEGMEILKEKMGTMRWELMEKYSRAKRTEFPYGEEAERYWKKYIDDLMAEVEFYDYDIELHTKYVDKSVTSPKEAFAYMEKLKVKKETAFLFGKNR
ncbi:MAG: hypothetical protein E7260_12585 [Lachnospiraceae bacterium]|nr:hypothetical protein [Lachnospiraceae bacterium]